MSTPATVEAPPAMQPYLLRLEGSGYASTIYDTVDLSTVRGGSYLLLEAVNEAEQWLKSSKSKLDKTKVKTLSRGASVGIFYFEAAVDAAAVDAAAFAVQDGLRTELQKTYPNLVLLLSVVSFPKRSDYITAIEQAKALAYAQESGGSAWVVPDWNNLKSADEKHPVPTVCAFDGLRVGTGVVHLPENETATVSAWTAERREKGRELRPGIYKRELGEAWKNSDDAFANDFVTLCSWAGTNGAEAYLKDKLAVFYFDGNSFGRLIGEHCKTPDDVEAFDQATRAQRKQFLLSLLEKMGETPKPDEKGHIATEDSPTFACRWWAVQNNPDTKKLEAVRCIETLLWGGDECLFVVPARVGWELAQHFFDHVQTWTFPRTGKDGKPDGDLPLTYAAGLVFCSNRAPIQTVMALARALSDLAKNKGKALAKGDKDNPYGRNLLAYDVLESFDRVSERVDENWKGRIGGLEPAELVLDASQLRKVWEKLNRLDQGGFPHKRLHLLGQGASFDANKAWTENIENAPTSVPDPLAPWRKELKEFGDWLNKSAPQPRPAATLIHLTQLWNYLAPIPAPEASPGTAQEPAAPPATETPTAPVTTPA